MKNRKIGLKIFCLLILTLIITSGKKKETLIENCITELMKSQNYSNENQFFLKKENSEIIFFKKIKDEGYDFNNIIGVTYNYYKVSENSKQLDFEIQLWEFEDEKKAELTCNLVEKLISNSSYFEKPPKVISYYNNYCIFITTRAFSKTGYITKAMEIINNNLDSCDL